MILGMPVATFTTVHVLLSLIGIVSGICMIGSHEDAPAGNRG